MIVSGTRAGRSKVGGGGLVSLPSDEEVSSEAEAELSSKDEEESD